MLATLEILLPVFGLILAGFACRRRGVLGPNAASELNRFVAWLALPALLFDTMARATWQQLDQPALVATFSIGCVSVFLLILVMRLMRRTSVRDKTYLEAAYPLAMLELGHAHGSSSCAPPGNHKKSFARRIGCLKNMKYMVRTTMQLNTPATTTPTPLGAAWP